MYLNLMKEGWTLNDIDEMDIHFFLELQNYSQKDTKEQEGFIDDIW